MPGHHGMIAVQHVEEGHSTGHEYAQVHSMAAQNVLVPQTIHKFAILIHVPVCQIIPYT